MAASILHTRNAGPMRHVWVTSKAKDLENVKRDFEDLRLTKELDPKRLTTPPEIISFEAWIQRQYEQESLDGDGHYSSPSKSLKRGRGLRKSDTTTPRKVKRAKNSSSPQAGAAARADE